MTLYLGVTAPASAPARADEGACSDIPVLLEHAERLRGLSAKRPVDCIEVPREEFRRLAHRVVARDLNRLSLSKQRTILEFLGFIPAGYPFESCILDEYARRAVAFYSPYLKKIILPSWFRVPKSFIVHELTHALQDQNFDTKEMGTYAFLFDDRNNAAGMVLEGDAMQIETRWAELHPEEEVDLTLHQLPGEDGCELPESLAAFASSIYDYGLNFARTMKDRGRSIDPFFTYWPVSTRQVLHYEEVSKKQESGEGIQLGELVLRNALKLHLPPQEAVLAARGWIGDAVVFPAATHRRLRWKSEWADGVFARAFYRAFVRWWSMRLGMTLDAKSSRVIAVKNSVELRLQLEHEKVSAEFMLHE